MTRVQQKLNKYIIFYFRFTERVSNAAKVDADFFKPRTFLSLLPSGSSWSPARCRCESAAAQRHWTGLNRNGCRAACWTARLPGCLRSSALGCCLHRSSCRDGEPCRNINCCLNAHKQIYIFAQSEFTLSTATLMKHLIPVSVCSSRVTFTWLVYCYRPVDPPSWQRSCPSLSYSADLTQT